MAKVTIKEQFTEVATVLREVGAEDLALFIDGRIEVLDKRTSGERKPTKTQKENVEVKAKIVDALTVGGSMTATEVATAVEVSVQKASQLLKQLGAEGEVARTEGSGKTKTTFAVA
jgi:predicted transcriptional regulator